MCVRRFYDFAFSYRRVNLGIIPDAVLVSHVKNDDYMQKEVHVYNSSLTNNLLSHRKCVFRYTGMEKDND